MGENGVNFSDFLRSRVMATKVFRNICKFALMTTIGGGAMNFGATAIAAMPKPINQSSPHFLVAQIIRGCPRAEVVEAYETKTYLAYICQTMDGQFFYRGVNKKNGDQINVMDVLSTDGGTYYATNGAYTYWVDQNELRVTKNGKTIFFEPVLK